MEYILTIVCLRDAYAIYMELIEFMFLFRGLFMWYACSVGLEILAAIYGWYRCIEAV